MYFQLVYVLNYTSLHAIFKYIGPLFPIFFNKIIFSVRVSFKWGVIYMKGDIRALNRIMEMQRELLHKYFRGGTSPEEEKLIMDWADASPDNYHQYLEERKKWNALLLHLHIGQKKNTTPAKEKSFNLWKIAGIAASIALLVALSWIQFGMKAEQTAGLQSVLVPAGQRVQLVLEDGTKVWLNSKTIFSYPTSFGNKSREVQLEGEGFFEVAHDTKKPFIVKTDNYNIRVLGTTFDVRAYGKDDSKFETCLLNGSVHVSSNRNASETITLAPKEKVIEINGKLEKKELGSLDRFRWKDGLICIDDIPFDQLMKLFEDYFDTRVIIKSNTVSDYKCTGKFRQSDGMQYALRVIQKDLKFNFSQDDDTKEITIY